MVKCPECGSGVDQDFGMVTCPHCHAVFMIDYSGEVVYGEAEGMPAPVEAEEFIGGDEIDQYEEFPRGEAHEEDYEPAPVEMSEDPPPFEPAPEVYAEEDYKADEGFEPLAPPAYTQAPDRAPVDVSDFAESDELNSESSQYLYTLKLSRIDSKDLKEAVYYTLVDEKLELMPDQLMKKMIKGQLLIPDLHPLKAKRIIEQLQFYDIDITWRQRAVIIEDNEHEPEA